MKWANVKLWLLAVVILLGAVTAAMGQEPDSIATDGVVDIPRMSNDAVLLLLDSELKNRDMNIAARQAVIDSLRYQLLSTPDNYELAERLGASYSSFNNDSAIAVYSRVITKARSEGRQDVVTRFVLLRAPHLPLGGFIGEAVRDYESIDTAALAPELLPLYYDAGRQMYSHISAFYVTFPEALQRYERLSNDAQQRLLRLLAPESPKSMLNAGESLYKRGELAAAKSLLSELVDSLSMSDNIYARATHILADIANDEENHDDYVYYLALSSLADLKGATLEVTSLQELGAQMYELGDVERAHDYLSVALQNAVSCHAETRMLQTAMSIPLIERVHRDQLQTSRHRMQLTIVVMVIAMVCLLVVLVLLHRQRNQSERLRRHLEEANSVKDVYINQFLNLCSSYMDKLNQFCKIATRKISAGKVDELLQLTQSGKFVENQTKEFYEVFDNAFLHIYPDFVDKVNGLLQPEKRIVQRDPAQLTTDLRILAFMRMGIDDSGRIAELLNYSINTIYTYRNKLRNCAINRETFEADIRKL